MRQGSSDLLSGLLQKVSRSFYLTLRVLPGRIRPQISLAYLLARASDTIADTDAVPKDQRLHILHTFRQYILIGTGPTLCLGQLAGQQSSASERILLERISEALEMLSQFEPADQEHIRRVLDTIISGQVLDVTRFAPASVDKIAALETEAQLDDYIYRVAGCVGEFWTTLCREHLFPRAQLDDKLLQANSVRFGKGLQLVNVLRDLPADLRLGRCYLPFETLGAAGLQPSDLLNPANESRLRPLYERYLQIAEEHLEGGWLYTNHLPASQVRVRLACAWPILIGMLTLGKLRQERVLDPEHRVRISRQDVRRVLFRSLLFYPNATRWRGLLQAVKVPRGNRLPREATLAK